MTRPKVPSPRRFPVYRMADKIPIDSVALRPKERERELSEIGAGRPTAARRPLIELLTSKQLPLGKQNGHPFSVDEFRSSTVQPAAERNQDSINLLLACGAFVKCGKSSRARSMKSSGCSPYASQPF